MEVDLHGHIGDWLEGGDDRPCSPYFFCMEGSLDVVETSCVVVDDGSTASMRMDSYLDLHGINQGLMKVGRLQFLPFVLPKHGIAVIGNPLLHALDADCAMENTISSETGVLAAPVQVVPIYLASTCPPDRDVPFCTQGACEIAASNSSSLGNSVVAQNTSASSLFSHRNALLHMEKIGMGSMIFGVQRRLHSRCPFFGLYQGSCLEWIGCFCIYQGSSIQE